MDKWLVLQLPTRQSDGYKSLHGAFMCIYIIIILFYIILMNKIIYDII